MRTDHHALTYLVAVLTLAMAMPALAASYGRRVPGEEIFDNKTVLPLRIVIASNELAALRRNDREDVRATVYEGSNVWHDVGLHVKGAAGSRRPIDDAKPALTLAFGKFTPDQKFHGLRKIHLNNSVQDSSYMCENICSELFRKAGVPTPRVSYATVTLNDRKRGFYVLKEGFTKEMLGIYFKNTKGNLYDGGFLREVTEPLERDLGGAPDDVDNGSDLKALAKAAQEPDAEKRWEQLNQVLDVDRFITYAALEVMTWDWDGYMMNRNNYRIYHDLDTGKMVFFPHGMDQMFWEANHFIIPRPNRFNGLVARAVMETWSRAPSWRRRGARSFTANGSGRCSQTFFRSRRSPIA
jgi:spore coat protein H